MRGALVAIVGRKRGPDGRVVRELECGHTQLEQLGGRSGNAFSARCVTCAPAEEDQTEAAQVCTAIVMSTSERKARPCGEPARYQKRGQPRCALHNRRGAA